MQLLEFKIELNASAIAVPESNNESSSEDLVIET